MAGEGESVDKGKVKRIYQLFGAARICVAFEVLGSVMRHAAL